jgi:ubiquinone biosynthesis monooxygenase Coq7
LDVLHQRHPGLESLAGQKKALCCLGTTRTETGFSGVDGYSWAAMNRVRLSAADRMLAVADHALRALTSTPQAARPKPVAGRPAPPLSDAERRHAGALMRVNHVGEVCAQALYSAQALATADPELRQQFERAAGEETDHLAWTAERLSELGARPSLLNPLWYAGAFAIGLLAARAGDERSLGFLIETERQVERHLESHLERLPAADQDSRAIVAQMKDDEAAHAMAAEQAGGTRLPAPLRWAMRAAAKVMTTTAHYV